MRKAWFDYVAKIRKKESRKTKEACSHRKAMSLASESWPKEKLKIQRKIQRDARRAAKTNILKPPALPDQKPE